MMKREQKQIVETDPMYFARAMNSSFAEGWRIVPGTTAVALGGAGIQYSTTFRQVFTATLEREIKPDAQ